MQTSVTRDQCSTYRDEEISRIREIFVMIQLEFTADEIQTFRQSALHHPHPFVRKKSLVLLLHSWKIATKDVSELIDVSENTTRSYLREYQTGGLQKTTEVRFRKPQSQLNPYDEQIKQLIDERPCSTMKQICALVHENLGIYLKPSAMRVHLKQLGAKYRKVGGIPAKANIQAQEQFKKEKMEPRLEEAKRGKREVYFVDAAHFVLGAFLACVWCFVRRFVRTPSGRKRFNVLGAINAVTHKFVMVTNDTYITSREVGKLLRKLAATSTKPVTVILDNARYQRCKYVTGIARNLNIELLFLPPYSPNLNLIERLWKIVKKHCLNARYHSDFSQFQFTIMDFLKHMNKRHSDELNSTLTLKFQTFREEQILQAA
jgi:transposase